MMQPEPAPLGRMPRPEERPLLRVPDLIGLIPGMSRSAIYEAVKAGEIPSIRIRGKLFIATGELRRAWRVDPDQGAPELGVAREETP